MGRTKDAIWSTFTLLSATGDIDKAKCSKCEYQCSTLVQHMRDHWEKGENERPRQMQVNNPDNQMNKVHL